MSKSIHQNAEILIIGYNRPDLILKRLVNASSLRDRKISLSLDYKDDETVSQMKEVVSEFEEKIGQYNDFKVAFHQRNLGLARNVTSSISSVLKKNNEVIIIEDDIEFNQYSIESLDLGLHKMENDPKLASVGMFSPIGLPKKFTTKNFYRYSKYFSCWGWATTKNIWSNYELDISRSDIRAKLENSQIFNSMNNDLRATWLGRFGKLKTNTFHTWDIQFQLMSFENDFHHLIPFSTVANNEGFNDLRSAHTKGKQPFWMKSHNLPDTAIKKVNQSQEISRFLDLIESHTLIGDAQVDKNVKRIMKLMKLKSA